MGKEKSVLIIGGGGIGSYICKNIFDMVLKNQINEDITFCVADFDAVEKKNVLYQNFEASDVLKNKAEVIAKKYAFIPLNKKVESFNDLRGYDCIICCVDNFISRRLLFEYAEQNPNLYWIDLRSEGRNIAYWTKHKANTLTKLLSTLREESGSRSCQLKYKLDKKIIDFGNVIIASIGTQLLLNWLRNDDNDAEFIGIF